jgi:hypothetical protein
MNIILGKENAEPMREKYVVLELDTIQFASNQPVITAFCLVEPRALDELMTMESFIELHANLIKNYRLKNWKFCEDALEHLIGKWNGDVDSFYREMEKRIARYKIAELADDWDGVIKKY